MICDRIKIYCKYSVCHSDCQYHMVEENGFQRGGTIRDLDSFYQSEFYLLPQEKKGISYMDGQSGTDRYFL